MITIERTMTIRVNGDSCWVSRDPKTGRVSVSGVTLKDADQLAAFAEALADVAQTMKREAAVAVAEAVAQ
jgi:hypothetical protein